MESRIISIPRIVDNRGGLAFAEGQTTVPFEIQRVFWIYDIPQKAVRGGHAHWQCSEVVVAVHGGFTMLLDDGFGREEVRLDSPDKGIVVPAGVWCELKDFAADTVLLVMASHHYDVTGYVHDYEEYLKAKRS